MEDDQDDDAFVAIDNLDNELYIGNRDHVDNSGIMFTPCDICRALKLNPISNPVPLPEELSIKSPYCQNGKIDVKDECKPSAAEENILNIWSHDDSIGHVFGEISQKIRNACLLAFWQMESFLGHIIGHIRCGGKSI